MADKPKKAAKQVKTLRQAADDAGKPKRRSLKVPVGKVGQPIKKAGSKVGIGRVGRTGKRLVPKYFRNSWRELKEVTWPNRPQTVRLTFAVLLFATVFGVAIAVVDYGLDRIFRLLLT